MLSEALTYPFRGENAEEALLVGVALAVAVGLLLRLGVLAVLAVAPVVLLAGYALAVFRESAETGGEGDDSPPQFSDFRALTADGVRALVVSVGYLFVPAVALALTVGGAAPGTRPATLGTTTFVLGAGTVVLFVSLAFAYLLPAALVGVARTGDLRSAVERGRLHRIVTDSRYFVGWVGALVVVGIAGLLFGVLRTFGRPGELVALALGFYALVVAAQLLGRSVRT
jgi:hypothetical protein